MPIAEWQRAYEQGELVLSLQASRAASPTDTDALYWRALAAFRFGEMAECADIVQQLVPVNATSSALPAEWHSLLSTSVVASGELARFDQALAHLHGMLSMAKRAGDLSSYVRARGTAANCFALMGDPWAAQRLLAELVGFFMGAPQDSALEATVRSNLCATYLIVAQWAKRVGDTSAMEDAVDHAQVNVERCRELAALLAAPRVKAYADVHAAELDMLRGEPRHALAVLPEAIAVASRSDLNSHVRHLRLTQAEAALDSQEDAVALESLEAVATHLNDGHEIHSRVRFHQAWQRLEARRSDTVRALQHAEAASALIQRRGYKQLQAQSRYLRTRLELEHLYRYRSSRSLGTAVTQPGALP